MIKQLKTSLLPYLAPVLYYSTYLKLKRQIDNCFEERYDVFCFFPAYHIGGAEKVHIEILKALRNYRTATFITHKSASNALREAFVQNSTSFVDIGATGNYPIFQQKLSRYLSNKFNSIDYKCTVFGCNAVLFYHCLPMINNSKIKTVDLLHAFAPYIQGIEQTSLHYVPFINTRIVINKKTVDDYKTQYMQHGISEQLLQQIEIIYNALDETCVTVKKDFSLPLKCLFVGRNSPEKRFHLFLQTAAECQRLQLPVTFTAVGKVQIHEPINAPIQFVGEIKDKTELKKIYNEQHILLTTSVYEGFPLTIMEAMCHGLINISTNVGGIPEHIHNGKNGFLIHSDPNESKIIEEIRINITYLLENFARLTEVSNNSISYAQQHFNLRVFRQKYRNALINNKS